MTSITFRSAGGLSPAITLRRIAFAGATLATLGLACGGAHAQSMGIATMQPGTIAHAVASAIAQVLKEKAELNVLVQPTAGETVAIALVGRGEAELGLANAPEVASSIGGGNLPQLRLIGALHPLRAALFVRNDAPMKSVADLKGKRVTMGFSAMRVLDGMSRAILATGGLTEKDIRPVPVPNVIRGSDDFVAGSADAFLFAFGAPKVREVNTTVGGVRALELPDTPGMAAANKISRYGYLTKVAPGPAFVGVPHPMDAYSFDHVLYTHAKVSDEAVYRIIETLANNKADLVAVAPPLREFSEAGLHKAYAIPYHPGALKYFKEKNIPARALE